VSSLDTRAIVIVDTSGTIRLWSAGAVEMFAYAPEEAIGKPVDLIIPAEYRDEHWSGFRTAMATGVAKYDGQIMHLPVLPRDGDVVVLKAQLCFLRDARGQAIGAMAILEKSAGQAKAEASTAGQK
jgi:PAS domain S-box-containing protein